MSTHTERPVTYAFGEKSIISAPEAASQSFKKGEAVQLTNGKVAAVASDGVAMIGITMGDASGVTDTPCLVMRHTENTFFEVTADGTSDPTSAVDDLGVKYALLVESNITKADVDDTDHDALVLLQFPRNAAEDNIATDDNTRALAQFLPATDELGDKAT